jgi:hypothetical protein
VKNTSVALTGRIGVLVVEAIDNAKFDAMGLEAREIIVTGPIDHSSIVVLRSPGGRIEVGGRLDGASTVSLTAHQVDLRGSVRGTGTSVTVRLTGGGTLRFAEIAGTAQLFYRRHAAGDPPPIVEGGVIREAGRLLLKKD